MGVSDYFVVEVLLEGLMTNLPTMEQLEAELADLDESGKDGASRFDVLRGDIGPSDLTAQKGDSP